MAEISISNRYGLVMTVEKFLASSSAKKRDPANNGLIALCKVTSGRLVRGVKVKIHLPEDIIEDKVVRIEENHRPLSIADPGQSIGVCFEKLTLQQINKLLGQPANRG